MKKILLFMLLIFIGIGVHAEEYTDYSDFSYSENEVVSDELTDVKVERRYKFYKLNKVLGSYALENDDLLFDTDDYIYTDFSDWSEVRAEDKNGRIIESKQVYQYDKSGPIDVIKLKGSSVLVNKFIVYEKGKQINYDAEVEGETIDTCFIKFDHDIELDDLSIRFSIGSDSNQSYNIRLFLLLVDIVYKNMGVEVIGNHMLSYDFKYLTPGLFYSYYSDEKLAVSKNLKYVGEKTYYRYKDKLYRTYTLKREYYDDYLAEGIGDYVYKDDNLYKDFYAFRTRSLIPDKKLNIVNSDFKSDSLTKEAVKNPNILQNTVSNFKITDVPVYDKSALLSDNYVSIKKTDDSKCLNNYKWCFLWWLILIVLIILLLSKRYKNK